MNKVCDTSLHNKDNKKYSTNNEIIIAQNVDTNAKVLYTISSDNKKTELVPPCTVLYSPNAVKHFDFTKLPCCATDPEAMAAIYKEDCKNALRCNANLARSRASRAFVNSINRPNGILTANPDAARRRCERAEAAAVLANSTNLSLDTINNVPTVRMIDRRIPTIDTGTRGVELFPPGTRVNNSWNQEEPGNPVERLSAGEKAEILRDAARLNRQRILNNFDDTGRLRVAPARKRRTRLPTRQTFSNFL